MSAWLAEDEQAAAAVASSEIRREISGPVRADSYGMYWEVLSVDPARVLADVQAKRAIIAHEDKWGEDDTILRLLAQPFADHVDFDPAWRVSATDVGEHQT